MHTFYSARSLVCLNVKELYMFRTSHDSESSETALSINF